MGKTIKFIDREKARETVCSLCRWEGTSNCEECEHPIDDIPAADVRPVITCGKCKYGKYTGTEWFCDKHSGHADKFGEDASYHEYHSKHWFCADGEERKHE